MAIHLSPQLWARNARYLPLIAVDGTKDGPYKSKGVVAAYQRLRYKAEFKLFDYGHSVWRLYMDKGQVYTDTATWRKPRNPRRITFQTTRLRWNRAYWIRLDSRSRTRGWTKVDIRARWGNRLSGRTSNVTGLTLFLNRRLANPKRPVKIRLDDQNLQTPFAAKIALAKKSGRWSVVPAPPATPSSPAKTAGLEGPIDDFYYSPVLVVYGTKDPLQIAGLKQAARRFARFGASNVRYPVKPDIKVTPADIRKYNLLLVGSAHANLITRKYANRLPIQVDRQAVTVGGCSYRGPDKGVAFIHPNPDHPKRYLLVVAGTTARAPLRARWLPHYLPDYAVFDKKISRITNFRILGPTRGFLTAGFFDNNWRLSAKSCAAQKPPPLASPRRR
jgi:hypothetical protein